MGTPPRVLEWKTIPDDYLMKLEENANSVQSCHHHQSRGVATLKYTTFCFVNTFLLTTQCCICSFIVFRSSILINSVCVCVYKDKKATWCWIGQKGWKHTPTRQKMKKCNCCHAKVLLCLSVTKTGSANLILNYNAKMLDLLLCLFLERHTKSSMHNCSVRTEKNSWSFPNMIISDKTGIIAYYYVLHMFETMVKIWTLSHILKCFLLFYFQVLFLLHTLNLWFSTSYFINCYLNSRMKISCCLLKTILFCVMLLYHVKRLRWTELFQFYSISLYVPLRRARLM